LCLFYRKRKNEKNVKKRRLEVTVVASPAAFLGLADSLEMQGDSLEDSLGISLGVSLGDSLVLEGQEDSQEPQLQVVTAKLGHESYVKLVLLFSRMSERLGQQL